jgi:hypothetical protein
MSDRDAYLAGERLDDVCIYLSEAVVSNPEALVDHAEQVDDGLVLVIAGDSGRSAFQKAVGLDPMSFAREAMEADGTIDADLTGGTCPNAGDGDDHAVRFLFSFAEAENEEAGDIYAEGPVIHAYASCACGQAYSDRWNVGAK